MISFPIAGIMWGCMGLYREYGAENGNFDLMEPKIPARMSLSQEGRYTSREIWNPTRCPVKISAPSIPVWGSLVFLVAVFGEWGRSCSYPYPRCLGEG